jgi:hypothetical protein
MDWIEEVKQHANTHGIELSTDSTILLSSAADCHTGLYEAEWELRGCNPSILDDEIKERAMASIFMLLQNRLIDIYVDKQSKSGSFNGSEQLLPIDEALSAIASKNNWEPWSWEDNAIQYAFFSTAAGKAIMLRQ